jgi:mRNA-degrading endonuclease RelE of RelBE toxin-antitoxin system
VATAKFQIIIAPIANAQLADLEVKIRRKISDKIDTLTTSPELRGKPLQTSLKAYRSIKIARYRAIYQVPISGRVVNIVCIGIRKKGDKNDVYRVAQQMLNRSQLGT